jgi:radical SAM protein with 4Fe4S-binding SPASM domain
MIRSIKAGLSVLQKPLRVKYFPLHMQLEATSKCNLKCVMCAREDYVKNPTDMKITDFNKIINTLKPQEVSVAGQGEPLMNPNLMEMVRYAKKQGASINVSSNLTLLNPETADEIVQSGLDLLQVSIDSSTRETYQRIRGHDYFQRVIDGVTIMADAKKRHGSRFPFTRFRLVLQKDNFHEVSDLVSLAKKLGVDEVYVMPLALFPHELSHNSKEKEVLVGELRGDIVLVELMKGEKLSRKLKIKTNLPLIIRDFAIYWSQYYAKEFKKIDNRICMSPWISVYVHLDGTVNPCPFFYGFKEYDMGNILSDEFQKVWNGERYKRLRSAIRDGKKLSKVCETCVPYNFSHFKKLSNMLPGLINSYLKLGFPFGKPKL